MLVQHEVRAVATLSEATSNSDLRYAYVSWAEEGTPYRKNAACSNFRDRKVTCLSCFGSPTMTARRPLYKEGAAEA
jgi:hypothetical protein